MKRTQSIWPLALGIMVLGGLGALGWSVLSGRTVEAADPQPQRPSVSRTVTDMQAAFQSIAQRVSPAVVSLTSRMTVRQPRFGDLQEVPFGDFFGSSPRGQAPNVPRTAVGSGSGFIVRADGYILTNDHVVGGADSVTVRLDDGREFAGKVSRDQRSDLAIVKIDASDLPTLPLSEVEPAVGQWAIAFGSPFGLEDTMTVGVVSAMGREKTIGGGRDESRFYPSLIQTDASINPGNSGGPLLDIEGNVMGVNVAIGSPTGANVGIGFAIPARTARYVIDELITKGSVTRGYLGFAPQTMTASEKAEFGVDHGAIVTMVEDNSAAAQAGIQVEDVVVSFNDKPVRDATELRDMIARAAPGQKVKLVVRRDGKELTLEPAIQAIPKLEVVQPAPEPGPGKLGIEIAELTPGAARQLGVKEDTRGVVVASVAPASPAAEAGLRPGDILTRVNRRAVASPGDMPTAIADLQAGKEVSIVVRRGDASVLLRAKLR